MQQRDGGACSTDAWERPPGCDGAPRLVHVPSCGPSIPIGGWGEDGQGQITAHAVQQLKQARPDSCIPPERAGEAGGPGLLTGMV